MSDADLNLVERAAARGLIPSDALDRARRDCRGPASDWLLKEKLLTQTQLRDLLEDELPLLPRPAAQDPSWSVLLVFFAVIGITIVGLAMFAFVRRPALQRASLAPRGAPRPTLPAVERLVNRAEAALNFSDFSEMLKSADMALALDPLHEPARLLRAQALIGLDRAAEAVTELESLPSSLERDRTLEQARLKASEKP